MNASSPARLRPLRIPQAHQIGDLLGAVTDDGFHVSLKIDRRHVNLGGVCSGGVIATLFDVALGLACCARLGSLTPLPTISLTIDFVAPTPIGATAIVAARVVRMTRSLGFSDALLFVDGEAVGRANGIFRLPRRDQAPAGPIDMIFAQGA